MNLAEIDQKVAQLTKAETSDYSNEDRLVDLNIWNQKVVTMILDSQDTSDFNDSNRTGYSILDASLVANQRDYNFGISDDILEIKRVEVTYDGTNSYIGTSIDSSDIETAILDETTTDVDTYFPTTNPYYDWKGNSIWLYPKPTASVGSIFVEVSRTAKDFTASDYTTGTAQPGFDKNFHVILPYGMALEYFLANRMQTEAKNMQDIINDYELRLRRQYGKKERSYHMRMEPEFIDYN